MADVTTAFVVGRSGIAGIVIPAQHVRKRGAVGPVAGDTGNDIAPRRYRVGSFHTGRQGLFGGGSQGIIGGVFLMIGHGLVSGALFMCVGVFCQCKDNSKVLLHFV